MPPIPMKEAALRRQEDTFAVVTESIMKRLSGRLRSIIEDEQGGEVLEYVLIAGLITVAALAVIGAVGTKVAAKWSSVNSSL